MTVIWHPMLSEYSVFTALIFFVAFTVLCYLVSKYAGWRMLWVMGAGVIFTIVRCTIPVELAGTRNIHLPSLFSEFFRLSRMPVWRNVSPLQIFLLFWMIGSFFFLGWFVVDIVRYIRSPLEADSTPSRRMYELYEKVLQELDCPKKGTLLMSSHIVVPQCAGFRYPDVIFPSILEDMSDERVCYILKHEILHYLHHDVWINSAVEILRCLLWWNPAVYLLQYTISNLLELRCDSNVCKGLSSEQIERYSKTLLGVFRIQSKAERKSPLFNGLLGGVTQKVRSHDVKRRFIRISNAIGKKPQQKWVSVVAFIIMCTLFAGSYTVTFQTIGFPPEDEIGVAVIDYENGSDYIMRYPDGTLKLFIDHQAHGILNPNQLEKEPYSSMLIVDVY